MTGIPRNDWDDCDDNGWLRTIVLLLTRRQTDCQSIISATLLSGWLATAPFSGDEYINVNRAEISGDGQIIDRGSTQSLRTDQYLAWKKRLTYRPESCLLLSKVHVRLTAEGYKLRINMICSDVHLHLKPRQEKLITVIRMFCLMLDLSVIRLSLVATEPWVNKGGRNRAGPSILHSLWFRVRSLRHTRNKNKLADVPHIFTYQQSKLSLQPLW